ncbi:MAG: hypothetical protein SPH83_06265 [Treponema sp.]|nr:hypothetical protein [Spirochaetales bacterium]MDY6190083.1 hypothetical protein [Treponema sp.]
MLKSQQELNFSQYTDLYDKLIPQNHLFRKTGTDLNFSVEVKKLFNEVTAQYPKRKTVSFHLGMTDDDNDLISILIKNGANENESAVLTLTEPYVYEFYFNGGQLKDYTELSEW